MVIKFWEVHAFKEKGPGGFKGYKGTKDYSMLDDVLVDVAAENETEALKKAKSLVKRKYYRLGKMWEYLPQEHQVGLQEEMQMTLLKMQKQLLDILKGQSNA